MELKKLLYELDSDGIATLRIGGADRLNILDTGSWREIHEFFAWADTSDEIRVIILTGTGDQAFVAGADLNRIRDMEVADSLNARGQKALDQIERCSKPVIAAVNGYAIGGGCELALACDFRVAAQQAVFGLPETGVGILPGSGGTQRLTRLIGLGRALDMILLGRRVGAEEAVQIGLASRCVPGDALMAEAKKVAHKLLAKGPVALRLAKRVVQASLSTSQDVGMLLEAMAFTALIATEDKNEGVDAFLEKRKPEFQNR